MMTFMRNMMSMMVVRDMLYTLSMVRVVYHRGTVCSPLLSHIKGERGRCLPHGKWEGNYLRHRYYRLKEEKKWWRKQRSKSSMKNMTLKMSFSL